MIVDLNLVGKTVIIAGGGSQAVKRLKILTHERCSIIVISHKISSAMQKYIHSDNISHVRKKIHSTNFLSKYKPSLIIAATDDSALNAKLVQTAHSIPGCLGYSADGHDGDFAHMVQIDVRRPVKVALSTGGRSPIIAKRLGVKAKKALASLVTDSDLAYMAVQNTARNAAKKSIQDASGRKKYLYAIARDKNIQELIKQGRSSTAQRRAMDMLENWL